MKHMWSEEELQNLIEEQGGSGGGSSILENIVDSKGNKRFIGGNGTSTADNSITIYNAKWVLNGNNLIFEILGLINSAITSTRMKICEFTLPEFITNKINDMNGLVDMPQGIAIDNEGIAYPFYSSVEKLGNSISFFLIVDGTLNANLIFKIKYSNIIDSE